MQPIYLHLTILLSLSLVSSASSAAKVSPIIPVSKSNNVACNSLNLHTTIEWVLQGSPRLKSTKFAAAASEGERTQSGLYKNPEIGILAENIGSSGSYSGFESAQITYGLSQVIEIGGKRSSRMKMAEQGVVFSRYRQNVETLDVIRDVSLAFANAVAAQEMLKLASEQKEMADSLYNEVRDRVDAAREPLIQKSKAEITLSTAQFVYERTKRELDLAKHTLSNLWGGHDNDFVLEEKDFFTLTPPLNKNEAETGIVKTPYFKIMETNYNRVQANYELEKANSIPDPSINVGVRSLRDVGKQVFVVGVSIPIPIFNQNQGNIKKAQHEVSKAKFDIETVKLEIISTLHKALDAQVNAYLNAQNLKTSILPSAEKAFILSRQGYRDGKFPYLEVLDAQRTLFAVKEQYISVLKSYHLAKAEVERLIAKNMEHCELKEDENEE